MIIIIIIIIIRYTIKVASERKKKLISVALNHYLGVNYKKNLFIDCQSSYIMKGL